MTDTSAILNLDGDSDDDDLFGDPNSDKINPETNSSEDTGVDVKTTYDYIPSPRGGNIPSDYDGMIKRVQTDYTQLPFLDYDDLYAELAELSVKSCPTPTLQVLNSEIQKVQSAKDRLSEIFVNVLRNFTFKKRAVDILRDAWSKFSEEKSADKRKGSACFVLSDFEMDYAATEALMKSCNHIIKNLDSLHDSLSRRITIIQLQLKMHDMGRGALPSFDFAPSEDGSNVAEDIDSMFEKEEIDPAEGRDAKAKSW